MAECGAGFYPLAESFLDGPTFADPNGPWTMTTAEAYLRWVKANGLLGDQVGNVLGKLGELSLTAGAAIDVDDWEEYERLRAWNLRPKYPLKETPFVSYDVAIAAEMKAAKEWACLLERVNRDLEEISAIDALPEQKPPPGSTASGWQALFGLVLIFVVVGFFTRD